MTIAPDDVLHARAHQDLGARNTRGTDAGDDHVEVFHALADDLERVDERRQGDDCRAVLIVVEDRDVDALLQLFFDVETIRRGNVFEVDTTEGRREAHHGLDDLVGIFGVETDREGVDAAEGLEQQRLAFHDGHGRQWADVAKAEDRSAITHDRDRVLADGVLVGRLRAMVDRHAHPSNAGRVGHRQIVAVAHRCERDDFDLAALVHLERAVVRLDQLHAVDALGELDDLAGVRLVAAIHDDFVGDGRAVGFEPVDTDDVASDVADLGRQATEYPGGVVHANAQGDREGRSWNSHDHER